VERNDPETIRDLEEIISGNIKEHYDDPMMSNFTSIYYKHIEKNTNKTEKYYLMSARMGNVNAMGNLGNILYEQKKV